MKKILVLSIWYLVLSTANAQFIEFPLPVPSEGAWYTADNTPNDSWPGGYDLTLNGDATYGTDRDGNSNAAFSFDGTGDYASAGDVLDQDGATAFSGASWIYFNSSASGSDIILGKHGSSSGSNATCYLFYINGGTGQLYILLRSDALTGDLILVQATNTLSADTWHHVAFTYDGSKTAAGTKLFIDGIEETPTGVTDNLSGSISNTDEFQVGARNTGSNQLYWDGLIDDIRIIPYELTAEQVSHIFNGGR